MLLALGLATMGYIAKRYAEKTIDIGQDAVKWIQTQDTVVTQPERDKMMANIRRNAPSLLA